VFGDVSVCRVPVDAAATSFGDQLAIAPTLDSKRARRLRSTCLHLAIALARSFTGVREFAPLLFEDFVVDEVACPRECVFVADVANHCPERKEGKT
jgi:hypothetical protein